MQNPRALPEKKYFKIGEVADLVGVEPHVLRYWETQFPQLRPHKARSGHRLYRRREVETLLLIRELLHVQRFTIAGARQALRQPGGAQSLLPRFFDGGARTLDSNATLPPQDFDGTDEDGPVAQEIVLVEAQGLDEDELRDALEQQAAGAEDDIVELGLEVEPRAPAGRPSLTLPELRQHPAAPRPMLSAPRRAMLEDALQSARAVLAILDREDHRDRPQA